MKFTSIVSSIIFTKSFSIHGYTLSHIPTRNFKTLIEGQINRSTVIHCFSHIGELEKGTDKNKINKTDTSTDKNTDKSTPSTVSKSSPLMPAAQAAPKMKYFISPLTAEETSLLPSKVIELHKQGIVKFTYRCLEHVPHLATVDVSVRQYGQDDALYERVHDLWKYLPRGLCFVIDHSREKPRLVHTLAGLRKFTYDQSQKHTDKEMPEASHLFCTKENGEVLHISAFPDHIAGLCVVAGSKNVHALFRVNSDELYQQDLKYYREVENRYEFCTNMLEHLFNTKKEALLNCVLPYLSDINGKRETLCFESCRLDSAHLVTYDDSKVYAFALTNYRCNDDSTASDTTSGITSSISDGISGIELSEGRAKSTTLPPSPLSSLPTESSYLPSNPLWTSTNPMTARNLFIAWGLDPVLEAISIPINNTDLIEHTRDVFYKKDNSEGAVVYVLDGWGQTLSVYKWKNFQYIFWRSVREKLKGKYFCSESDLIQRICAENYHVLHPDGTYAHSLCVEEALDFRAYWLLQTVKMTGKVDKRGDKLGDKMKDKTDQITGIKIDKKTDKTVDKVTDKKDNVDSNDVVELDWADMRAKFLKLSKEEKSDLRRDREKIAAKLSQSSQSPQPSKKSQGEQQLQLVAIGPPYSGKSTLLSALCHYANNINSIIERKSAVNNMNNMKPLKPSANIIKTIATYIDQDQCNSNRKEYHAKAGLLTKETKKTKVGKSLPKIVAFGKSHSTQFTRKGLVGAIEQRDLVYVLLYHSGDQKKENKIGNKEDNENEREKITQKDTLNDNNNDSKDISEYKLHTDVWGPSLLDTCLSRIVGRKNHHLTLSAETIGVEDIIADFISSYEALTSTERDDAAAVIYIDLKGSSQEDQLLSLLRQLKGVGFDLSNGDGVQDIDAAGMHEAVTQSLQDEQSLTMDVNNKKWSKKDRKVTYWCVQLDTPSLLTIASVAPTHLTLGGNDNKEEIAESDENNKNEEEENKENEGSGNKEGEEESENKQEKEGGERKALHVTLYFVDEKSDQHEGRTQELEAYEDKTITMRLVNIVTDSKAIAAQIEFTEEIPFYGIIPHITLHTAEGIKASYSSVLCTSDAEKILLPSDVFVGGKVVRVYENFR